LFLKRSLKNAQLVSTQGAAAAFDLLVKGEVQALAGLRQALIDLEPMLPGSRMVDGNFLGVPQAIGVPRGRDSGLRYVRGLVEEAGLGAGRARDREGRREGRVSGAEGAVEPGPDSLRGGRTCGG